jgi:hypothetical protein
MPMSASRIRIAVFAVTLMWVGPVWPLSDGGSPAVTGHSKLHQLRCRLYFGCTPISRAASGTVMTLAVASPDTVNR